MNPYSPGQDLYTSTADQRFNSFSNPSAMAFNQSNGPWGVNPNMMTPAYTAAYRPTYNGYQGNPHGGPSPGFSQSFNQVFNPFASGGVNYGGNTHQQQSPYYDSLGYNPLDSSANIAQKWVVPGFASWLSYKYLAKPLGEMGNRFTAGAVTGLARGSFSAGTVSTMARIGGSLGGFAAATLGPMAVAEAAVWGVDKALFDPYIAQRQMSNNFRRNFAGVTFSDGTGNPITGSGFSRSAATIQASQLSRFAAADRNFDQSEVSNITDLASRSGLLDNVQGGQVGSRMKSIMTQMKTIMQLANSSDVKEITEMMSKMQASGVAPADYSKVASKLSGMAAIAGTSLQKMMDTVGAQGGYMYGGNGFTPFVGQLMAANAYGAFSSAQRSGLLSPALLARMGGVEGATQSANVGLMSIAQTPYSKIHNFLDYLAGGTNNGTPGMVGKFGGIMAGNPMSNIGMFNLVGEDVASAALRDGGMQRQLHNTIQSMKGRSPGAFNEKGEVDAGALFSELTSNGMPPEAAKALVYQKISMQDPASFKQSMESLRSASTASGLKTAENLGLNYGGLSSPIRAIQSTGRSIQGSGTELMANLNYANSKATDWLQKTMYGKLIGDVDNPFMDSGKTQEIEWEVGLLESTKNVGWNPMQQALEASKSDPALIKAISEGDRNAIKRFFKIQASNGKISSSFRDEDSLNDLVDLALRRKGTITSKDAYTAKTAGQILEMSEDKAKGLEDLYIDYSNSGAQMSEDMLQKFHDLTGEMADPEAFLKYGAKIGGKLAYKDQKADFKGTKAEVFQLFQRVSDNLEKAKQAGSLVEGNVKEVNGDKLMSILKQLDLKSDNVNITGTAIYINGPIKDASQPGAFEVTNKDGLIPQMLRSNRK